MGKIHYFELRNPWSTQPQSYSK